MNRGSTLLAFDFDGTLAPICDDPGEARLDRGAAALLEATTRMAGVTVAIVSGREAADVATRVDCTGAYIIGSHGIEIRAPGGVVVRDSSPMELDLPENLRRDIENLGLRLEHKKHGFALHWRGFPFDAVSSVVSAFRDWASAETLDIIEGRCVVEARSVGGGKEDALRWVAHAVGAGRVIYAGDDVTDLGALRFASQRGRALFVASGEHEAPAGVTVVESFRELFRLIREEVMI